PGSSTIGDVPRDLSRIHSIRDFGYLPHTPSAPIHGPSVQPFSPFENTSYTGYHVQSSKYAPEEPGVISSDSFPGYAPAPSPSNSTSAIYTPTPHTINPTEPVSYSSSGESYVEKSLPNESTGEESATTSLRQEAKKIAGSSGEIPSSVVQSTQELLERSSSSHETSELADSNRSRKAARERPVVAEYTPTPLADLERMKEEELKRKKLKEGKRREMTKDRGRAEKRRPLSEDEMSSLFGDDEMEPKPKKAREEAPLVAKKAANRKSKPELSSSRALDAAHKDSHPSNSAVAHDAKSSVGSESLKQSSTVSNSVTKPTEISPDVVAAAKKRIAREKAEDRRAMVAATVRKAPTAREQLHARMNAIAKEKSAAPTSSKTLTSMV
ncbi:hypothetical protein ANCDUO_09000, partial [Ancylostoma duodenale]